MNLPFLAFPSIEGFHNVVRFSDAYPDTFGGPISYRGKIKLHGTNAGIRIFNGEVAAQSRTQIITPQNDNMGFARWVESQREYWSSISKERNAPITVFGEWCGSGIMKGVAISNIGKKIFAVFAVAVDGAETPTLITNPQAIAAILGHHSDLPEIPMGDVPSDVHVLPWYTPKIDVDFRNRENLQVTAAALNRWVEEVEAVDPWVARVFGIDGTGEGIVFYPEAGNAITMTDFANLSFKAKGEKHKAVKTKEAVQVDPEVAATVDAFVEMFVTEARLDQAANTVGNSFEPKKIGAFLKWICNDVLKESVAELEASKLTWEQVQKPVQQKAKLWFLAKSKAL